MSWHTSGVLIHADYSDDFTGLLKKLGVKGAELQADTISFDDATSVSMDGLAVACVDGWTCLFSSFAMFLIDDKAIGKIAKTADVFSFILEGASDAAGFTWWTGGKKVRERMIVEGTLQVNKGEPLAEEKSVFASQKDDEQRILLLLEKMTVTLDRLSVAEFVVFSCENDFEGMLDG